MQPGTGVPFSTGDAISYGWRKLQQNVGPLLTAALVVFGVNLVFAILQRGADGFVTKFVIQIIGWVISLVIAMGWIRIALKIVDGQTPEVNDLFVFDDRIANYAIASILIGIGTFFGLLLLVIPAIILWLTFGFYGYNIVDKGDDIVGSFTRSAEITRGRKWELFAFFVAIIVLNIIGLIALIVGVIVTSAISIIAVAYVYRSLAGEPIVE